MKNLKHILTGLAFLLITVSPVQAEVETDSDITGIGSGLPADATFDTISTTGNVQVGGSLDVNGPTTTHSNTLMTGTYGSGDDVPTTGAGTRFIWYPKKAAFRAGRVSSTQWDEASVGAYSFAFGRDTIASGANSYAEGAYTIASGASSHAEGNSTTASTTYTHAEGVNTTASGGVSHAEGDNTTASGYASHSEGRNNTNAAAYGHVQGYTNTLSSTGTASHVEGQNNSATSAYAHTGGRYASNDGNIAFVHGHYIKANAIRSVMFGSYSSIAERDANALTADDTMKLVNMDLIVGGTAGRKGELTVLDGNYVRFGNYSTAAPVAGDCDADAEIGRRFLDITAAREYVCMGAARGWDYNALTD